MSRAFEIFFIFDVLFIRRLRRLTPPDSQNYAFYDGLRRAHSQNGGHNDRPPF